MERSIDITGQRFGMLTVVAFDRYESHSSYWRCTCDCGGEKIVRRDMLKNGHCKSCGCLRRTQHGQTVFKARNLSDEEKQWIIKHYKNTKNDVIIEKLHISSTALHRFARENGLVKTKQFMRKAQRAAADAAVASHKKNGTYPPKGYHIPRSEEFGYKPGHKESARTKTKRIAKFTESLRHTIKVERARIHFGLEQRTKLRLTCQARNVVSLRHTLRKHGYIIERGGMIVYYDENTKRMPVVEARKFGDRNYVAFEFKHISEREGVV